MNKDEQILLVTQIQEGHPEMTMVHQIRNQNEPDLVQRMLFIPFDMSG